MARSADCSAVVDQALLPLTEHFAPCQEIEATQDWGEEEDMRDTTRELADRFHFLRLPQCCLYLFTLGYAVFDALLGAFIVCKRVSMDRRAVTSLNKMPRAEPRWSGSWVTHDELQVSP